MPRRKLSKFDFRPTSIRDEVLAQPNNLQLLAGGANEALSEMQKTKQDVQDRESRERVQLAQIEARGSNVDKQLASREAIAQQKNAISNRKEFNRLKEKDLEAFNKLSEGVIEAEGRLINPLISARLDKTGKYPTSREMRGFLINIMKDKGYPAESTDRLMPIFIKAATGNTGLKKKAEVKKDRAGYMAARKDYGFRNTLQKLVPAGKNAKGEKLEKGVIDFSHPGFNIEDYVQSMEVLGFGQMARQDAEADQDFKIVMDAYDSIVGSGKRSPKQMAKLAKEYATNNRKNWGVAQAKIQEEFPELFEKLKKGLGERTKDFFDPINPFSEVREVEPTIIQEQPVQQAVSEIATSTIPSQTVQPLSSGRPRTLVNDETGQTLITKDNGKTFFDANTGKRVQF